MNIVSSCYKWDVPDFCLDATEDICSPFFHTGELKWFIKLKFNNKYEKFKEYLGVSLHSSNNFKIKALANLSILDNKNHKVKTVRTYLTDVFDVNSGLTWMNFIKKDLIIENQDQIIINGILTIFCEIVIDNILFSNLKAVEESTCLLKKQKNFFEFLENDKFSDVLLVVGKKKIPAHRILLVNKSPVFKSIFNNDVKESQEHKVVMKGIKPKVIEELLHFIYDESTFEIQNEDIAENLLTIADKYEVAGLVEECEKYFINQLSMTNVVRLLNLANTHKALSTLKREALNFISVHAKKLQDTPEFKTVSELPADLIFQIMNAIINKI